MYMLTLIELECVRSTSQLLPVLLYSEGSKVVVRIKIEYAHCFIEGVF